jgi:putative iron-regulated protein
MKIKTLISISLMVGSFTPSAHQIPFKRNLVLEKSVQATYLEIAQSVYKDSLIGAQNLQLSIEKFISHPTEENLKLAKSTWTHSARIPYGPSEVFRFVNGPIDFEPINDGITTYLESINFEGVEGLVNAWPLDEAYLDYVVGDPTAGLINDPSIEITPATLISMNERDGEKAISTGFHAIEFLLWGQDLNKMGPGNRPVTDYTTEKNAERRKLTLASLSKILVDHLSTVYAQFQKSGTNYRSDLNSQDPHKTLVMMMTSMVAMAGDELKSERIENALLLEDQEEEHSCFSDTTMNDIAGNFRGVSILYRGVYNPINSGVAAIKGQGFGSYVAETNPILHRDIEAKMVEVESAISSIKIAFDRAIIEEQDKVQVIIDTLDELEGLLLQAANELGLNI